VLCAYFGDLATVRLLLGYEAQVLHRGKNDVRPTSLFLALEQGHIDIAKLLLGALQEQGVPALGGPLLCAVAACGAESLVRKLLADGLEPDTTKGSKCWTDLKNSHETEGHEDWTPLLWASKFGQEAVVRLLLEKGAQLGRGTALPLRQNLEISTGCRNTHQGRS
jgi:ankyrin repeat protein